MAKAIKTIKVKITNPNKGKVEALSQTVEILNKVLATISSGVLNIAERFWSEKCRLALNNYYRAFQRNFGKSVKDRAPGMFMEIIRRKAENAGGSVLEFSTKTTKLSQYCHKCGKYTKKPLSQRWHTCCNLNIQRDLYSAFLAGSVVENKAEGPAYCLDTADVTKRWRSTEAVLQRAVSHLSQVANGRQLPSSFGLRARDRAARLRSSDALVFLRRNEAAKTQRDT